jgi:GH15 family glucan-1,4-alpha-glucosidase
MVPEGMTVAPTAAEAPLIEDHALIGDLNTAALVARDGTIDFLCLPDFDSDTCFASLLGNRENGWWKIAPTIPVTASSRRYRPDTLIVETDLETDQGAVRIIDLMPVRSDSAHVVRIVQGLRGEVPMRSDLAPRFANGFTAPILTQRDGTRAAVAGPDAVYLRVRGQSHPTFDYDFVVKAGEAVPFSLSWARPYQTIPAPIDAAVALGETQAYWESWCSDLKLPAIAPDLIKRSLITLKACTYAPSGAVVAAPTFGLPEALGGERNWDYRFCWVRDASLTITALMRAGIDDEAAHFFNWLADAVGGAPQQMQIMYGIRGERRLTELELDWLSGYSGARPVRVGNAAYAQFQLDVYGEFATAMYRGMKLLGRASSRATQGLKTVCEIVKQVWTTKDRGIWEVRGPTRSFTASKVSAWSAINAWVKTIEDFKLQEDAGPWIALRQQIFDEVCEQGFDKQRNSFTQYYGSTSLDASLLQIPLTGFLPATDPRVIGTVKAIEEDLMPEGLVLRYRTDQTADGLRGVEGVFLPCSFWLATTYHLMGRTAEARALFDRLAALCNDVGLLAEEYLPGDKRQVGNFPQAFSHLALIDCAYTLSEPPDVDRMDLSRR